MTRKSTKAKPMNPDEIKLGYLRLDWDSKSRHYEKPRKARFGNYLTLLTWLDETPTRFGAFPSAIFLTRLFGLARNEAPLGLFSFFLKQIFMKHFLVQFISEWYAVLLAFFCLFYSVSLGLLGHNDEALYTALGRDNLFSIAIRQRRTTR